MTPQAALAPLFEATTKAGSQPRLTAEDLEHVDILMKGQTCGGHGLDMALSLLGLDAAPIDAASPAVNFSTLADVIGHVNPQKTGPNESPYLSLCVIIFPRISNDHVEISRGSGHMAHPKEELRLQLVQTATYCPTFVRSSCWAYATPAARTTYFRAKSKTKIRQVSTSFIQTCVKLL